MAHGRNPDGRKFVCHEILEVSKKKFIKSKKSEHVDKKSKKKIIFYFSLVMLLV